MADMADPHAFLQSALPALSEDEDNLLTRLPDDFYLECVYYDQSEKHLSGAAVIRMLRMFHEGIDVPEYVVVSELNWHDPNNYTHETYKEDMARYMAKRNYVPSMYYPGRYILPKAESGLKGADFIAANSRLVLGKGFEYVKALLVKMKAPVYVRRHFTTRMYPMSEELAHKLDSCGHALLIVGYNSTGFIVHDPWRKDVWGGNQGGKDDIVSYDSFLTLPYVNCCAGYVGAFAPIKAFFEYPKVAIIPDRDIDISLQVSAQGITGILSDIVKIEEMSAVLNASPNIEVVSAKMMQSHISLLPGQSDKFTWTIKTPLQIGSFPMSAQVSGVVHLPALPWERNSKSERIAITTTAEHRIDVKDLDWLNVYGRH